MSGAKVYVGSVFVLVYILFRNASSRESRRSAATDVHLTCSYLSNLSWNTTDETLHSVRSDDIRAF